MVYQKKLRGAAKTKHLANMRQAMASGPVQDAILRHLAYRVTPNNRTGNLINAHARAAFKTAVGWRPPIQIQRAYKGHQNWLQRRSRRSTSYRKVPQYKGRYLVKSWRRGPY